MQQKIEKVPLSNNIISRRIDDIAHDSEEVLYGKFTSSRLSIPFDESSDRTSKCHVVAFSNDGEIQ